MPPNSLFMSIPLATDFDCYVGVKLREKIITMQQSILFEDDENNHSWFRDAIEFMGVSDKLPAWPDAFGAELRFCIKNKPPVPIKTLSLFSGGGGLDIGFSDAGFKIVECVEIEEKFAETLRKNSATGKKLQNTKITCIDIRSYEPSFKNIDFIIGGPPCQTFSAAGARAAGVTGLDDQRGTLFEEYVRLVKQLNPKGFLFENVYRIVGAQGGNPWKLIQKAFQDAGYKLHWRIIDAADYGVPQHRERLIIVGVKDGEFLFPYPTHGPDSQDNRPYYSAGKAVTGIDTSKCKIGINGRHGHLLDSIPTGLNYSFYTEKLGHPNPVFGWRSKFSDYLYKADPETPVRTIKAQGGQYTGPFSWHNRPFNFEELKRLQTFPDDYKIVGNRQSSIVQLGNSVPPQVARILALSTSEQMFNTDFPFNIKYMPPHLTLGFRKRKSRLTKIYAKKAGEAIASQTKSGMFKDKSNPLRQGKVMRYLIKGIELSDKNIKNSIAFNFEFTTTRKVWRFILTEKNVIPEKQYSINIRLSKTQSSILNTNKIELLSMSDNVTTLSALWKFLEKTIKDISHKDDLIQLFGYYQYHQKNEFNLSFHNKALKNIGCWKMAKSITDGLTSGTPLHIDEISAIFQLNKVEFSTSVKKLKSVGYEIRNHNTNPQIDNDCYLIPYPFPTLNERSLQRLTRL